MSERTPVRASLDRGGIYARRMPLHHVAYATRDVDATTHFYEDLMGFALVHTEITALGESWIRHVFYDIGPNDSGGERGASPSSSSIRSVSSRDGPPTSPTESGCPSGSTTVRSAPPPSSRRPFEPGWQQKGIEPAMEQDHGWCHSLYYLDPNGIMVELCRDTPGFDSGPGRGPPAPQRRSARRGCCPRGHLTCPVSTRSARTTRTPSRRPSTA